MVLGMGAARYQAPAAIVEFAARMYSELNIVIGARMRQLGIAEEMIGFEGVPGIDDGRAFVRFPSTQIGGNLNPALNPEGRRGIALDHGVFDAAHPRMSNVLAWRQSSTALRDRVDAAIAHEYVEATLVPPLGLMETARAKWLNEEAIRVALDTTLPITERAKEILRQYRDAAGQAP